MHLDEETLLTEAAVRGILNFITAGKHSFGQGESRQTNRGVKAISRQFSNYSEKAHLGQSPT